ncbi:MAG: pentapeptide repeat-containing protein [Gloeomargarita sp. SKYBB_i_bin120]|nr:pentapeptide repeat-containing protein [Gloeomargarita sp. SKYG98]MCS7292042.1 pentapeptide repeat-containing protein [Gloeomargarita sp. SKYB120]MDW8177602.1 pentapeptide repeat-containing protein [Gloeomargarita sp. SKYBB_i_bin120]
MNPALRRELAALQQQQVTGTLVVQAGPQQWQLYLFMGRLLYATGGPHRVRRWYRAVRAHCPQFQPDWRALGTATPWEYGALVQGTANGRLTPSQAKAVISSSVLEVLFAVLAQENVTLKFLTGQGLSTQLALLQVERVLEEATQLHQQWQAAGPGQLQNIAKGLSPDLAPVVRQPQNIPEPRWLPLLNGQYTLWDLMSLTRKSLQATVQPVFQWVQQGWVEFQILLDLPPPVPESGTFAPADTENQSQQPLIACLDDSPAMLKILEGILVQAGYRVVTITEPMSQMATLLTAKPAVILMDWLMPHVNGYELCSLLRKTSVFRETPIFVITGHESIVDRMRARLAGVTGVVKKPLNPEELLQLVSRYAPLRPTAPAETSSPEGVAPALTTEPLPPEPEPVMDQLGDPVAQAQQLLARYAAGERDFSGIKLIGCNLQGANLEGVNLSRADLMLADLSGCLLIGAKLVGANLIGAELVKTNLQEATLTGANLIGANFSQANLSGSQLVGSNLSAANFCQSRLRGADLSEALAAGTNFTSADLQDATLYAANLHGAVLNQANLERANLTGANLWQAKLAQTNLEGANLTGAVLPQETDSQVCRTNTTSGAS